jgi:hypothetical protein
LQHRDKMPSNKKGSRCSPCQLVSAILPPWPAGERTAMPLAARFDLDQRFIRRRRQRLALARDAR